MSADPSSQASPTIDEPRAADPSRTVILLAPQERRETLIEHLEANGITGRIATVTAGWQEREDEVQDLQTHVDGRAVNLRLYARCEEIFRDNPDLAATHRERQSRLRRLRRLYAIRLDSVMDAALTLAQLKGDDAVLAQQRNAAVESIRSLDEEHLVAMREIRAEFGPLLAMDDHPAVRRHREEVAEIVADAQAIAIAGGHVAVLLNRLRLFDGPRLAVNLPIIGWSAGAMVLCEKVVLYHDSPPQGAGNAEVFEEGLGLVKGVVALPHAGQRLLMEDRYRVGRFAKRFAASRCLAMDEGAALTLKDGGWTVTPETRQLYIDGGVGDVSP